LHEALLLLFRNRPTLALELLRDALHVEWLPAYTEVRIDSAELTDIQPAEYRADLVVLLLNGVPVLGIVVEVQLSLRLPTFCGFNEPQDCVTETCLTSFLVPRTTASVSKY
jgi:hypothetical protein